MTVLRGTFPVVCTPFRDDGTIDTRDFDSVVEFAVACGVDGLVYPGTASEVGRLTAGERSAMVSRLGERLGGRRPFVVGASALAPEAVLSHIRDGADAGAVAAMVMAPDGTGDQNALASFFARIAEESPIPLMLQNAPKPFGAGLDPLSVGAVARAVDKIRYVKEETVPCGQNLTKVRSVVGDTIEGVFGGAGGRAVTDELARGALGTVPAVELADLHVRLVSAWFAGEEAEARRLFEVTLPALSQQAVFRMHMTKRALAARGVIRHTGVRADGPTMDAGDHAELAALLARLAPEFAVFPLKNSEVAA